MGSSSEAQSIFGGLMMNTGVSRGQSKCKLCNWPGLVLLATERHGLRDFPIGYCANCDVIQTDAELDDVSPDYVQLAEEAVNANRIWCQSDHKLPAFRYWIKLVAAHQQAGSPKVLDIGCGTGGFLRFAQNGGFEPYGFDSSQAQIDYASRDIPSTRRALTCGEYVDQLGDASLEFDLVTMWDVLEHIREPSSMIPDVISYMKPGALFFAAVPAGPIMRAKQRILRMVNRKISYSPWEHVFYYSNRSLPHYVSKWGLNVIEVGSVPCYPRPASIGEICRRAGFCALRAWPRYHPQVYVLAKKSNGDLWAPVAPLDATEGLARG